MLNKILVVLLILISSISLFSQDEINEVTSVDSVDLEKYSGIWYEIAKIPNFFQDHCIKNTTASYSIDEDGNIIVINKCVDEDNEFDSADGIAKIVDYSSNSKLEVSFVSILGIRLFWGDYWIIGLADDYRYAVIGMPSRKYGWILSRTQKLNQNDLSECYQILTKNGYEVGKFELSIQE